MIRIFTNLSPDLKDSGIEQKYRTNRTQPKNTPTPPEPNLAASDDTLVEATEETKKASKQPYAFKARALGGFKLERLNRVAYSALAPQDKSFALVTLNSSDWVFTQSTIVSSVNVEENGFTITEDSAQFVNDNQNTWTTPVLKKWYKTFIGAHNFKDHNQVLKDSKGIILDAVLRKITIPESKTGEYVLYVDILVATNRNEDPEWAKAIEIGNVKFMSMGAISSSLICSRCGCVSSTDGDDCEHMQYELGMNFFDKDGIKRRIAAIISDEPDHEDASFMVFKEASYLSVDPAFRGAVASHLIEVQPNQEIKFQVPRKFLAREAFQYWGPQKKQIQGVPTLPVLEDEDITLDDIN